MGVSPPLAKNKQGNFVARSGYYYRHGKTHFDYRKQIEKALGPGFEVVRVWDHFTSFKGGAGVAQNSHFGVEFREKTKEKQK